MPYKKNLVSIIIPHYNYSHYIDQCLVSILKQKYKKFEIIIVDDCSREEEYKKMLNIVDQHKKYKN
jgi:glycosyltransferase involved in cell wall biosynthesis